MDYETDYANGLRTKNGLREKNEWQPDFEKRKERSTDGSHKHGTYGCKSQSSEAGGKNL